jgi:hypothetical protein
VVHILIYNLQPAFGRLRKAMVVWCELSMMISIYLSTYLSVLLSIYLSVYPPTYLPTYPPTYLPAYIPTYLWLYNSCGPWPLFSFLIYTQLVGLLGRGISPSQGRYLHPGQHRHRINAYKYPCLEWDPNSRTQCSSGRRRFMRPLWSAHDDVTFSKYL